MLRYIKELYINNNKSNASKKLVVLKIARTRWGDFKSRLLREFVHKKHQTYNSPTELYDFLSAEQWAKFVASRQSEEFKERSQKARELQALNEHPHFLGSSGYAKRRQEWMKEDPLSSQSSCASVSSSLLSDDRSFDWIRARTKKKQMMEVTLFQMKKHRKCFIKL
ncbi:PREDICTED: uncharacterized protein LOC109184322 [Ipomoea nil]|uniref:uncharacterized protein LOC109184322 n=1 Tax=Ipomoea nil TaxID=35883 RepID=UPI000901A1FE|nr:PREDICTED: uncharacterized protein LOC109184322 [Ipomoea nil]